ncbi:DJ-1/PfpI family protein [Acetobacteraceae bacterium KSS12]|uniref:DJ-1/PfpI family protein n=1 Tax=Rhizosaccharibacter radicis TaxID=2782605 RepID=A0ABT1VSL1_9PROT|nr:DJ-1/PfpI family protein [Acetobacteraceae bacterium KSS12]
MGSDASFLASVCTGSLLGAAGLIRDQRAACHWAWRDMLLLFGAVPSDARVEHDGNLLTGGGVTAGIDFGLALVALLVGQDQAERVQLMLEYAPQPPFDRGRPELARPEILHVVRADMEVVMNQRRAIVRAVASGAGFGTAA